MAEKNNEPFVIERTYDATADKVWHALTDNEAMKKWYFKLPEFRAEVNFAFEFYGGPKDNQYMHKCRVTEVIPGKKLSHTWRYEGYEGDSLVTFELFPEGNKTRLKLTHSGLESFAVNNNPHFDKNNFATGWTSIIGTSLKNFVEA